MTEAAVHTLVKIEVVEGVDEMSPVEMSIDTEHLTEDGLADVYKLGWEATALANPVTRASKLREGCVQSTWAGWNWGVRARGVETA